MPRTGIKILFAKKNTPLDPVFPVATWRKKKQEIHRFINPCLCWDRCFCGVNTVDRTVAPKCSCSNCRLGGPWRTSSSTAVPSHPWSGAPRTRVCSPPREQTMSSASGICRWSRATWAPGWRGWRTCPLSYCSCTRVSRRSRRSTGTRRYPGWWSPRLCQDSTCSGQYLCSERLRNEMTFAFTWGKHVMSCKPHLCLILYISQLCS